MDGLADRGPSWGRHGPQGGSMRNGTLGALLALGLLILVCAGIIAWDYFRRPPPPDD